MTFDLRRVPRILVRCAGALLVLALALASVAPANSATGPKIVSVDITGNLHVPTATIMAVVSGAPGRALRSQGGAGRLRAHQRAGILCRHRAASRARAAGRRCDYLPRRREPGHHEDRLHRQHQGAERHAPGTDGSFGRTGLQHQHVPSGRAQDQQLLRAHRLRRPSPDARQRHQPRSGDRRRDAHDPRRPDGQAHLNRRRSAASAAAAAPGDDAQARHAVLGRHPRRRLQSAPEVLRR